ncbi:hypothetical protein NDU88_008605 [Pleurodeles waltl]|uniref:Uncharacterized protein n=1 Tax=Pleurodeles waltl TaxID=8319 RepID=A0AAV7PX47_PLEWA|nr:hypothetical protein NDU88_008605 [Pleurodeles waltl]
MEGPQGSQVCDTYGCTLLKNRLRSRIARVLITSMVVHMAEPSSPGAGLRTAHRCMPGRRPEKGGFCLGQAAALGPRLAVGTL